MEIDTNPTDEPLRGESPTDNNEDGSITPVSTPRNVELTLDSAFIKVERLLKMDHGVDGDTKEKNPIISLSVHPQDLSLLATGGHEGTVRLWRLPGTSGQLDPTSKDTIPSSRVSQITTLVGHSSQVNTVRFSPTGDYLATGSADCTLRVYSGPKWKLAHSLRAHTLDVTDVAWFSPSILVSTSSDRNSIVWDAETGGRLQTLYSDKGSCPKGIVADPKGDYLCVLFDEGLIDVYRRNSDGKFRLSRHLELAKDDPRNFAKSVKTTLYARRGTWTPAGDHLLLPLGVRGRCGPCGVMYERSNMLEPTPGEAIAAAKVFTGHPSRVVLVSIRPGLLQTSTDDPPFFLTAMVSVDGVVSLWASTVEKPIAVVANITGPLRVCTDACWSGNSLLLSSSDGSVTAIEFNQIGTQVAAPALARHRTIDLPAAYRAPVPLSGDIKSAQVELRVGGKRKIQPVVTGAVDSEPAGQILPPSELKSQTVSSVVTVRNSGSAERSFVVSMQGGWQYQASGSATVVAHNDQVVVVGCTDQRNHSWVTVLSSTDGSMAHGAILVPEPVKLITVNPNGVIGLVIGSSSVCIWKFSEGQLDAIVPDASIAYMTDEVKSMDIEDTVPVLHMQGGAAVGFNPRIGRWVLKQADTN